MMNPDADYNSVNGTYGLETTGVDGVGLVGWGWQWQRQRSRSVGQPEENGK